MRWTYCHVNHAPRPLPALSLPSPHSGYASYLGSEHKNKGEPYPTPLTEAVLQRAVVVVPTTKSPSDSLKHGMYIYTGSSLAVVEK